MAVCIFLLIFGAALLLAAAVLWFSKDPGKSVLMYKVAGAEKMPPEKARKLSRQIASAIIGVAMALILFSVISLIRGS